MPKAVLYVLGRADKSEYVGWSCGEWGPLEDAAIYRSVKNAEAKIKQFRKHSDPHYFDVHVFPLNVSVGD